MILSGRGQLVITQKSLSQQVKRIVFLLFLYSFVLNPAHMLRYFNKRACVCVNNCSRQKDISNDIVHQTTHCESNGHISNNVM